ncbi:MAG: serine/threonine protein kinase [Symploca sp. SIO2E9]|nr:serine/threonine protein kinase [Symploca sp. SIO2E9]
MKIHCTRPGCSYPHNVFADLDNKTTLQTVEQKYCTSCGMPLILRGRYIPLRLLGQGGFGAAFLAKDRDTPTCRQCVVKQFQPTGDLTPKQLEIAQNLFRREAEVLERLGRSHPQIPDLFAFFSLSTPSLQPGKEDEFFYLVQEFIDGQDLEEELKSKGQFSQAQVLEVLLEILKVLKFVHSHGQIHRDIKPSNIMRQRHGRLYLLDFGAVKEVTAAGSASGGKSTRIYSGVFAPPEQIRGSQVYPSTDLYSLAVTAITLLTGQNPETLYDSYSNQWLWINYSPVSDNLEAVLNRMLLPVPEQRFQSAQEVINALNRAKVPQVKPQTPSLSAQIPPPQVQNPVPAAIPVPQPVNPPPAPINLQPRKPRFSLLEVLSGAAFTGFEGALLFIALGSLVSSVELGIGLWGMIMGGLIFAEFRRIIEKIDLILIAGITLAAVAFLPDLRDFPLENMIIGDVIITAIVSGAGAIATAALFRLIYQLLSRWL